MGRLPFFDAGLFIPWSKRRICEQWINGSHFPLLLQFPTLQGAKRLPGSLPEKHTGSWLKTSRDQPEIFSTTLLMITETLGEIIAAFEG